MSFDFDQSPDISSQSQGRAAGKALRERVPRSAHAAWKSTADRPDVVSLLEESNRGRLPTLVPLRYSRMLQSPLAFLRGAACIMAGDLAGLPRTDLRLQICGDCHLLNFGWFATPERNLIFDLNDFDESRRAPWEWDIKRLAVSVVLAARGLLVSKSLQQELAKAVIKQYREHLAAYALLSPLEMWYVRIDEQALLEKNTEIASLNQSRQVIDAARQRTVEGLLPKLTERHQGKMRFKDRAPLIFHPPDQQSYQRQIRELLEQYRKSLSDERCELLDRYQMADVAYRVSGVGSVGLRCGIILMLDPDGSPLILQIKEARPSALEKFVGPSRRRHHGHRIIHGQRLMQAASDMFLGWANDDEGRSYYFRQLRDMKMSFDVGGMPFSELKEYALLCGWALARAHAKAGDISSISGYLGSSDTFDEAVSEFAMTYATQTEEDHAALQNAAESGRIVAKDESQLAL